MDKKRFLALQIKPVGNECNINCTYCYASPFKKHKVQIMDSKTLQKIVKESIDNADEITVSWHGGEPTIAGLPFFQKYMFYVKKYKRENQTIINRIQTNATLITNELAEFFKENDFIVSVSIDGPEFLHDLNRCDFNQKGTFAKTMIGVNILRQNGIEPEVIATISQTNVNYPKEIFDFFHSNKFKYLKLNAIYDSKTDKFSISNDLWLSFVKDIFNLWLEAMDSNFHIREIDDILTSISGQQINCCNGAAACLKWISIDPSGDMYPCEYLRASKSYGNISTMKLEEVLTNKNYKDFVNLFERLPKKCLKCKLLRYCGNGCPATRVKNNKTVFDGNYVYCKYNKEMFNYVTNLLKNI